MHGTNYEEPPRDLIDNEPKWEVEEIVNSQCFGHQKTLQYHIHWKGYSLAYNTWEPAANVHAPERIKEYYQQKGAVAIKALRTIKETPDPPAYI